MHVALAVAPAAPSYYASAQPQSDDSDTQAASDGSTISAGQTVDQVVAVLGSPTNVIDLGLRKIYLYKDMRITFVGGRLTDAR